MEFMKHFYQHLKEGKTASAAVHQSMKCLRKSEKFSEVRYWALFQLIGDDVKMEFEADGDIKNERYTSCLVLFVCFCLFIFCLSFFFLHSNQQNGFP